MTNQIQVLKSLNLEWDEDRMKNIPGLRKFVIAHPMEMSIAWQVSQGGGELTAKGQELIDNYFSEFLDLMKAPKDGIYETLDDVCAAADFS